MRQIVVRLECDSSIQNSMRDGYNPSFLFEMMTNSYGSNALFYSPQPTPSLQPQLEIVFTLGSAKNQLLLMQIHPPVENGCLEIIQL